MTRIGWWTRIASCFGQRSVARFSTAHHPLLEVTILNGQARLEGETVNHSFGSLHRVLVDAFRELALRERPPRRVLLLGLGGGSAIAILRDELGIGCPIVAVEIDAEIVRLGREVFGLRRRRDLEIVVADAVDFVAADTRRYDFVLVDAFIDRTVPERLRTRGFLEHLRARLEPGGLALFNTVADDPRSRREALELAQLFEEVLPGAQRIEVRTNLLLAGRTSASATMVADGADG